ncbi:MAG: hypothetical protein OXQ30_16645, partial [Boseongicola sp.]|nr:hypothetical protein [Boseongicola sp.]
RRSHRQLHKAQVEAGVGEFSLFWPLVQSAKIIRWLQTTQETPESSQFGERFRFKKVHVGRCFLHSLC